MDISHYTSQQQACIRYEKDHLFIEAGAGTGKTATLTAKVAYLMERRNELAFDHIAQLLAITFTGKAAGELAGRIRSMLRAEGLVEEALCVDGAWISTIHGMCSRMLRDHAFELGIDPTFTIVSTQHAADLRERAILAAVQGEGGLRDDSAYDALFDEYQVRGQGRHASAFNVAGILDAFVERLSTLPDGAQSIYLGPEPSSPLKICAQLQASFVDVASAFSSIEKPSSTTLAGIARAQECIRILEDALARPEADAVEALSTVFAGKSAASGQPAAKEAAALHKAEFQSAFDEFCVYLSWPYLHMFVSLAQNVHEYYGGLKEAEGVLDESDILSKLYRALASHPEMAEKYADAFALIMIDEFQDTDLLQADIATRLSRTDGANQLVTVGDAQQSIYRFRGADVNLFRRFAAGLPESAQRSRLDMNFRSHADILAFVNRVFGSPDVFGDGYLDLKPSTTRNNPAFPADIPRIDIVAVVSRRGAGEDGESIKAPERMIYEADAIAARLRAIANDPDTDWRAADMVLLMSSLTHSKAYADALQARGFEVIIAGGSVFWDMEEPALVGAILRMLANPLDNEAVYQVLASPLVGMGSADLARLAVDDTGHRRALFVGLAACAEPAGPSSACIAFAHTLLSRACGQADGTPPSEVVRRLFAESGIFVRASRTGTAGQAECANLLKAVSKVAELEAQGYAGPAELSYAYARLAESCPKDQPGTLVTKGQDAVRIMTIHASKGLEFPIVALAGFDSDGHQESRFLLESVAGQPMAALLPGRSMGDATALKFGKDVPEKPVGADDLRLRGMSRAQYHRRLCAYARQEQLAEKRRLFYVGATRAREALIFATHPAFKKDGSISSPTQVQKDVAALFEDGVLPLHDEQVDYGGSAPARYTCINLSETEPGYADDDDRAAAGVEVAQAPASAIGFDLPVLGAQTRPVWCMRESAEELREFSYSSISAGQEHELVPGAAAEGDATELGLAFHRVAEYMALTGLLHDGRVELPDPARIAVLRASYDLTDGQAVRLDEALERWTRSELASRAAAYPSIRPEVPFSLCFTEADGTSSFLNGDIDLLCTDAEGLSAFIVDYKTGGTDAETMPQLEQKHRLQALCYADAVFAAGMEHVELSFVRVERDDGCGQPQVVCYAFDAASRADIEEEIRAAKTSSDGGSL